MEYRGMSSLRCLLALVLPLGLVPAVHADVKPGAKRPNILYIMSDDHASAAISCYGSWLAKVARTPNLDKLARQGIRFTSGVVTNSICTPSRAALLTGQYSHVNKVYTLADGLDPKKVHLAHLLQQAGYRTGMIGKWHLHTDPEGFDYWNILPGQGQYINPKLRRKDDKLKEYKGYSEDVITDLSIDWIKNRDQSKPFMLFCHFKAPHRPWDPAPRFEKLYKDITIPEPPSLQDKLDGRAKVLRTTRNVVGEHMNQRDLGVPIPKDLKGEDLRKWAFQLYMKRYLRCVAAVDENVGRLLDFLEHEGLAEDTIVIYTSDQGFFLGEHGFYDKRLMYEPSLTTPLIVRYPGHTKAGTVSDALVLNIDHAPTFLEYAGAKNPGTMHGRSYKALLEGPTPKDWRTSVYYRYWMHADADHNIPAHYGVRTAQYTLIYYYGQALGMKGARNVPTEPEWEMFDIKKDPGQMHNLYGNPAYAEVFNDLQGELNRLRRELKDYQ
jgi:arylsulfatase A-like enzyme